MGSYYQLVGVYPIASQAIASAGLSTFTFTNVPFGFKQDNRTIVVVASMRGATVRAISSITIAGITANLVQRGSASIPQGIASKFNSSSVSGDIVVTLSGIVTSGCAIAVYAVYGLSSDVAESSAAGTLVTSGTTTSVGISCTSKALIFSTLLTSVAVSPITYGVVSEDYSQSILDSRKIYFQSSGEQTAGTKTISATWSTATAAGLFSATFN